ncbi:hypothetical protein [Pontibacter burrus]|uniref:Outer membrane protein beta-barrel domain-containing protein n=1 Tax=Pontibacter burrus TaxID=2704466 RepID=A0A6B3M020_9BACT|nr:hypothetical protein [Pontibacter burrus]NEM99250.1 hypothetical protein [Pontibacter burrus]
MRNYILKSIALTIAILFSENLNAQTQPADTTKQKRWYIPDAATLQFAGNMGMFAIGPGYDFAKERLSADLLYGFVPKFDSDEAEHLLTLKGTYKPWKIQRRRDITVIPFQVGLGLSYYFDDKYPLKWGDEYPKNYYWWSPKVRVLGFAGASVTKGVQSSLIDKIGLYGELGTYDLVATAWFNDESIKFGDIVNISLGARVSF